MNAPSLPLAPSLDALPWDNSYARLPAAFRARLRPTALPQPYLVAFNPSVADLLGLDPAAAQAPEFLAAVVGNRVPDGADPLAAIYAGHQFGTYVPQLGDGRAILLGEVATSRGRFDIQLKGAGRTPFSRMGDGRAVLRSTIREYLCSEAMAGLGVPTTRALAIAGSDQPVIREAVESAAVLTRVAPSHVRFGSFEVFFYRRRHDELRQLADHVIGAHYPQLLEQAGEARYAAFLDEVARRTGELVAQWQAVGFCHGVMNTDNMSILGLTIDYGPFGFMEGFDWGHVCNHSDETGRYAYNMQPRIAHWNLACLAQALVPLMPIEAAEGALEAFAPAFEAKYAALMRAKLGLATEHEDDVALMQDVLALMHASRTDYPIFFRRLGDFAAGERNAPLRDLFVDREAFDAWARRYGARLAAEDTSAAQRKARMDAVNPLYVLRNHLAETAIRKAADERDFSEIERLRALLAAPFAERAGHAAYADFPPDWAANLAVSCSS